MQYKLIVNAKITSTIRHIKLQARTTPLPFQSGQYIEFALNEKECIPFSIANAPNPDGILEFYIRESESNALLLRLIDQIERQRTVTLLGPFGGCIYRAGSPQERVILLAGGVGITQIKSIIEGAILNKDRRAFHLYWGLSGSQDNFLQKEINDWENKLENFTYKIMLAQKKDPLNQHEHIGKPYTEVVTDFPDLHSTIVYSCGPWEMTDIALELFLSHGLKKEMMLSDRFE